MDDEVIGLDCGSWVGGLCDWVGGVVFCGNFV